MEVNYTKVAILEYRLVEQRAEGIWEVAKGISSKRDTYFRMFWYSFQVVVTETTQSNLRNKNRWR